MQNQYWQLFFWTQFVIVCQKYFHRHLQAKNMPHDVMQLK
ncbi:hypothetical protein CFter6_3938 [Collimonas fungivorans]|uniref:Uncharacterized protein n=1 Tax=Collimonas fungivorans TaxID=158899 RepID=A0A127PFR3_9BURK|nr:hypothetical protein CFter6_3938 [Collimonas fungivorans]